MTGSLNVVWSTSWTSANRSGSNGSTYLYTNERASILEDCVDRGSLVNLSCTILYKKIVSNKKGRKESREWQLLCERRITGDSGRLIKRTFLPRVPVTRGRDTFVASEKSLGQRANSGKDKRAQLSRPHLSARFPPFYARGCAASWRLVEDFPGNLCLDRAQPRHATPRPVDLQLLRSPVWTFERA